MSAGADSHADARARLLPLRHLQVGWFSAVMGLAGLSLAWQRAVPLMGEPAGWAALGILTLAAALFSVLALATAWRVRHHPDAWAEDLRHPVRHPLVATLPIGALMLVSAAGAAGVRGGAMEWLWMAASLAQLLVTWAVLRRWWRVGAGAAGLSWVGLTPALFIPIVGNVLVPIAGVPLGHADWSAAQFGIGVLFWPVVLGLLGARIASQGLWPERLLPASFIVVAPPAATGLSALQLGVPLPVGWALWGVAGFSLLWVVPLLPRIAAQPFGLSHWSLVFPLAAFTALTLRLAAAGAVPSALGLLGVALLATTTLLAMACLLGTWHGVRAGRLLAPEAIPIGTATPAP